MIILAKTMMVMMFSPGIAHWTVAWTAAMVTGSVSLISMENSHANAGSAYHKDHPDWQMTDDDHWWSWMMMIIDHQVWLERRVLRSGAGGWLRGRDWQRWRSNHHHHHQRYHHHHCLQQSRTCLEKWSKNHLIQKHWTITAHSPKRHLSKCEQHSSLGTGR